MDDQRINRLWYLADSLTVHEAAALVAGVDPNQVRFNDQGHPLYFEDENGLRSSDEGGSVQTAFSALVTAITNRTLTARLRYDAELRYCAGIDILKERSYWKGEDVSECKGRDGETYVVDPVPSWSETTISVDNLREWLFSKGFRTGFFFPETTDGPDYLDPSNQRYAPKLAAAVSAWQAVTDPHGRSPKQALIKWLRQHAAQFDLSDDEGNPNETGIEEVAKVANWQGAGGAPKTPDA